MEAARDARGEQGADVGTPVTIIVPTFNERDNVAELVARTAVALEGWDAEILFVDDSTDDTAAEVERVAADSPIPVRVIHRSENTGGLGGAVVIGLEAAASDVCIVMDGDLQHPPELLPVLLARFAQGMPTSSPPPATSAEETRAGSARRCASASPASRPG